MYLTFDQICTNNGYQFESHFTTTDDGYILNLFRIPGLKSELGKRYKEKKSPIFFQHGIVDSADAFIMNTRERSLAF